MQADKVDFLIGEYVIRTACFDVTTDDNACGVHIIEFQVFILRH